jgi:hypothetical protein
MPHHAETLESSLFRQSWDDGLLDLLAGTAILGISLFWAFDLVALGPVVPVLLILLWHPLRRKLIEPRAGFVEFTERRTGRNRAMLRSSVLLGIAVLALSLILYWIGGDRNAAIRIFSPGIPAALLGILAVFVALGLGLPRFLGYATFFVVAGLVVALLGTEPEWAMACGGLVILFQGVVLWLRFIRAASAGELEG